MGLSSAIRRNKGAWLRVSFGIFGLLLIGWGAAALASDKPGYQNVWGGLVSAPFAIVLGVAVLAVVVGRPSVFAQPQTWPPKKQRAIKSESRQKERRAPSEDRPHA
jgi:hypothetical protein